MNSLLDEGRILQAKHGTVLWTRDLTAKQEEIETELRQSERSPVGLQAGSREGRNEVISQANHLQVESNRRKGTGGDFRQGEVLAQFPGAPFHGGASIKGGLRVSGIARIESENAVLRVRLDLSKLMAGQYSPGIRQTPWEWRYDPIALR